VEKEEQINSDPLEEDLTDLIKKKSFILETKQYTYTINKKTDLYEDDVTEFKNIKDIFD
jgi:hypothetical protein